MPSPPPPDTAILARVSTKEQASGGYSVQGQLDWGRRTCLQSGWNPIDPPYVQEGGHSDDIDYPALRRLLEDVYRRKVRRVVCQYHDRLARGDNLKLVVEWMRDWDVQFCVGDMPGLSAKDDASAFILSVYSTTGKLWLKRLRERTADGVAAAKKAGKAVGRPVAGFARQGGHLVPLPETRQLYEDAQAYGTVPGGKALAYRNAKAYYEQGEKALLQAIEERSLGSRQRFNAVKTKRLEAQRAFRVWLEQHRPLKSERASL